MIIEQIHEISVAAPAPWYNLVKYTTIGINIFSIIGIVLLLLIILSNEFKKKTNIILIGLIVLLCLLLFISNGTGIINHIFKLMYESGIIANK